MGEGACQRQDEVYYGLLAVQLRLFQHQFARKGWMASLAQGWDLVNWCGKKTDFKFS